MIIINFKLFRKISCTFGNLTKSTCGIQVKRSFHSLSGILTESMELKDNSNDEVRRKFDVLFPTLVENVIKQHSKTEKLNQLLINSLTSSLLKEKHLSGYAVAAGYKLFEVPENQSMENVQLACILGCCVNLLLASYKIIIGIVNQTNSQWCKDKKTEIEAVHQAIIMEKTIFLILKRYFSNHVCYQEILELFHKVNFKFSLGLQYDTMYRTSGKVKLDDFNSNVYKDIVRNISSYPFVTLPMLLALYCSQNSNPKIHDQIKSFLFELGEFLTTQDTVINCFGNNLDFNSAGFADISKGRCNWLIVQAMMRATENQKQLLRENYGRDDFENQVLVYNIYNDLGLFDIFLSYSEKNFYSICKKVLGMSKTLPTQYFIQLVEVAFGKPL